MPHAALLPRGARESQASEIAEPERLAAALKSAARRRCSKSCGAHSFTVCRSSGCCRRGTSQPRSTTPALLGSSETEGGRCCGLYIGEMVQASDRLVLSFLGGFQVRGGVE